MSNESWALGLLPFADAEDGAGSGALPSPSTSCLLGVVVNRLAWAMLQAPRVAAALFAADAPLEGVPATFGSVLRNAVDAPLDAHHG